MIWTTSKSPPKKAKNFTELCFRRKNSAEDRILKVFRILNHPSVPVYLRGICAIVCVSGPVWSVGLDSQERVVSNGPFG